MKRRRSRVYLLLPVLAVAAIVGWAAVASAATGTLEICKAAAGGASGATFSFTATNVATGAVKTLSVVGGSCSKSLSAGAGKWEVQENLASGLWSVAAIASTPATAIVTGSVDLTDGSVVVKVTSGTETQVSYTNAQAPATIKVCKWSATPAYVGATYVFSVGGTVVTAVAGPSAASAGCSQAVPSQPGAKLAVTETVPGGQQVAGVTVSGNLKLGSWSGGTANVTLGSGANVITYDDEPVGPPQTGYIEVCKDAYDQFTTGSFTFTIKDSAGFKDTETVPVGQCTGPIKVAAGNVNVTETAVPNTYVESIFTAPNATALGPYNLTNGTATVVVPVSAKTNGEVAVHFVNAAQLASVKVCKVLTATSGALAGTTFTFGVTSPAVPGTTFPLSIVASSSPGGACKNLTTMLPVGSTVTVSETGMAFVGANGGAPSAGASQTVTLAAGINNVTFTNQAYGSVEVCKVMAANSVDQAFNGTAFNFSVNGGASFPLRAGLDCSGPLTVPAGTATVSEAVTANFVFVSATATGPSGGASRVVSGTNPVTVSVPYPGGGGSETLVTFTNKVARASFKICKLVDPHSLTPLGGLSFSFLYTYASDAAAGSDLVSVTPPYTVPGGSCTALLGGPNGFPVINTDGTPSLITVAEASGAPYKVTAIAVDNGTVAPLPGNPNLGAGTVIVYPSPGIVTITYTNASS